MAGKPQEPFIKIMSTKHIKFPVRAVFSNEMTLLSDAEFRERVGGMIATGEPYADPAWIARARREALAEGHATDASIDARVAFYGGRCWICGTAPYEAIDHVKPLARGGSNWPANLRPACKSCNSSKGARWPFTPERLAA